MNAASDENNGHEAPSSLSRHSGHGWFERRVCEWVLCSLQDGKTAVMIAAGAGSASVIAAMKPSKSLVDLPTEVYPFAVLTRVRCEGMPAAHGTSCPCTAT